MILQRVPEEPAPLRTVAPGKSAIDRFPLHEQVAVRLREMIVTGQLIPGERLRIADLASRLEVSLTPLREALKILAEEQLVELTPNRATRISPITGENTRALFEVIAGIEALAAELAAARMSPEELDHLEERHAQMRACHETDSRDRYFAINREIHDLVVTFARNPILAHIRSRLAHRAERVRFLALKEGVRRAAAMQEHEDLMQALRQGHAGGARRAWRRHLLNSGEEACRIILDAPGPSVDGSPRKGGRDA